MDDLRKIFDFFQVVNDLKFTYRYENTNTPEKYRDTSAAHTWRMLLMAIMLAEKFKSKIDVLRMVKIVLIHDIPEVLAKDTPFAHIVSGETTQAHKEEKEEVAMKKICATLPKDLGNEIYDLWKEYDDMTSPEAQFAKTLDKIEAGFHILNMGIENWPSLDSPPQHMHKVYGLDANLDQVMDHIHSEMKEEFKQASEVWKEEYNFKKR